MPRPFSKTTSAECQCTHSFTCGYCQESDKNHPPKEATSATLDVLIAAYVFRPGRNRTSLFDP